MRYGGIRMETFSMEVGGRTLTIEQGKMAKQANGAVLVRYGDTVVLVTATASKEPREGVDFFPLTVDYEEKMYAAGKIPGGFIKREGRPSNDATLCARLIDRPIRPLFPKGYRNDVQIVATVLSVEPDNAPELAGMIGRVKEIDPSTRYDLQMRTDRMRGKHNICHGDFSPSNVIVGEDGNLYVCDWTHVTRGLDAADAATTYCILKSSRPALADAYLDAYSKKTDTPKQVKKKVGRAFTGGCVSVEEQREKGGNPEVCSVFKYNYFMFEHSDDEINEMMRKLVDKKELTWQDKKQIEELKKKQEEVRNQLQQMRQQMKENQRLEEKFRDQSEHLMEKQKELDRLFDEVMSDEIKELMKEMDRLMNEVDKKKVQEELENMKLKNEDLEKQLDQNIELMKRLELEKKVEQAVNKAEDLAKKQEELSKKQDDSKQNLSEQQQLSEQFQQLKKDIEQIQKDYKSLDNPSDFKADKELQNQIEQKQQEAENSLKKGKKKDASKSQKSAADELHQLSEQLAQAQMDIEQQELAEDSEQIRLLLKNLVQLSFNQESLISVLSAVNVQDPKYQQIIVDQNRLKDDFRNVEDSLRALAKRQIAVAAVVNKELAEVNSNIAKSMSALLQYNQSIYGRFHNTTPSKSMQYSMTSLNNLSLVLAESLDQMQNQMRQNQQQKQQGSCKRQCMKMKNGQCQNPGSGKPSPKSMRQMQEELNKQMQSLKKELEKQGNKPGRTKIGERNSMSSEFAKMAAQQEQIRRMMQEYGQEMKNQSGGNSKLAKEVEDIMRQMEQTEADLVNKTITRQTIQRQQQIMTRLLQHEKAEMEREKEDRRESTEGKDIYQPSQGDLEQYKKLQEKNMELFHTTPPSLNNYYKNKVNDYFFKF